VSAWTVTRWRNLGLLAMLWLARPVPWGWGVLTAMMAGWGNLLRGVLALGWSRRVARRLRVARGRRFTSTGVARRVFMATGWWLRGRPA